ncbi:hypothetical protein PR048_028322 [Dryococelus australis]|uniref:Uncharacterized protein n=1 Tax=Dryococelus australis TaxID=614101 RepID=A0ABQ9GIW5_9NEOP|nr:hypothetical protein PR048_028322 [Dryococelus australis]
MRTLPGSQALFRTSNTESVFHVRAYRHEQLLVMFEEYPRYIRFQAWAGKSCTMSGFHVPAIRFEQLLEYPYHIRFPVLGWYKMHKEWMSCTGVQTCAVVGYSFRVRGLHQFPRLMLVQAAQKDASVHGRTDLSSFRIWLQSTRATEGSQAWAGTSCRRRGFHGRGYILELLGMVAEVAGLHQVPRLGLVQAAQCVDSMYGRTDLSSFWIWLQSIRTTEGSQAWDGTISTRGSSHVQAFRLEQLQGMFAELPGIEQLPRLGLVQAAQRVASIDGRTDVSCLPCLQITRATAGSQAWDGTSCTKSGFHGRAYGLELLAIVADYPGYSRFPGLGWSGFHGRAYGLELLAIVADYPGYSRFPGLDWYKLHYEWLPWTCTRSGFHGRAYGLELLAIVADYPGYSRFPGLDWYKLHYEWLPWTSVFHGREYGLELLALVAVYPGYTRFPGLGMYKLHKERLPWADAVDACDEEQAYLAIVNSQKEVESLLRLFRRPGRRSMPVAYLGLSDHRAEGIFLSVLGTFSFTYLLHTYSIQNVIYYFMNMIFLVTLINELSRALYLTKELLSSLN